MSNCMIGFPNNIDDAQLSGGAFYPTLPLANTQTRKLMEVSRTTDLNPASCFVHIDQRKAKQTRVLAVVNHNLSTTAKWRVRASSEPPVKNQIKFSEDFSSWVPYYRKPDMERGYPAPDGSNNATRLKSKDMPGGAMPEYSGVWAQATENVSGFLTVSVWARAVTGSLGVTLGVNDSHRADYTLTEQWQRLVYTTNEAVTVEAPYRIFQIFEHTANNTDWELWGAQAELGVHATSYYPTTGAAAVRPLGYMDHWQSYTYDTGWKDVWPIAYPFGAREWEDPNWWGGRYSNEEVAGYTANACHILPHTVLHQHWRVDFDDPDNDSGYIQWGRVFIGPAWSPDINMSWGASIAFETQTSVQVTAGGAEYFDPRTQYRITKYKLENISNKSVMSDVFELQRKAGIDKEIYWIMDPADETNSLRTRYLARMRTLSPIEFPYYNGNATAFELKELQ